LGIVQLRFKEERSGKWRGKKSVGIGNRFTSILLFIFSPGDGRFYWGGKGRGEKKEKMDRRRNLGREWCKMPRAQFETLRHEGDGRSLIGEVQRGVRGG